MRVRLPLQGEASAVECKRCRSEKPARNPFSLGVDEERRGHSSFRWRALSDFDPEGEDIAHSLARSLRDDFGIDAIEPIKVALTAAQVQELRLPPVMQA